MASRASKYQPVEPASLEARGATRHTVVVNRAAVRRHGKRSVDASLHDISIFGCRIQSDLDTEIGERLWLRFLGGLPVAATVVWQEQGFAGCRFDAPIAGAMLRTLTLPA
jgi:hypothetical protein